MKAAPMTARPSFPLMKQGDIQNIYHLQMPRWLFTDPRYMGLALESKVAYTFLLNRFQLSRLNGWVNEDGAVFIIYTRRSLAEETQVSYRKIIEAMKELSAAGLIWEKRCGRGDANQIYLALVDHGQPKGGSAPFVDPEHEAAGRDPEPEGAESVRSAESALLGQEQAGDGVSLPAVEVPEQHFKKCGGGTSASAELELPEVPERHPNYTDKSHTDKSHTDLSHTDVSQSVPRRRGTADGEEELAGILVACELPCLPPMPWGPRPIVLMPSSSSFSILAARSFSLWEPMSRIRVFLDSRAAVSTEVATPTPTSRGGQAFRP